MDINQLIRNSAQTLLRKLKQKDPNAKLHISNPSIQDITNSMEQPVADVLISLSGGVTYNYSLTHHPFTGEFKTYKILETKECGTTPV